MHMMDFTSEDETGAGQDPVGAGPLDPRKMVEYPAAYARYRLPDLHQELADFVDDMRVDGRPAGVFPLPEPGFNRQAALFIVDKLLPGVVMSGWEATGMRLVLTHSKATKLAMEQELQAYAGRVLGERGEDDAADQGP